jgi:hypothetical protein
MRPEGHPTDLELERALLGESVAAASHLSGCEQCAPRVAWMKELGQHFDAHVYPRLRARLVDRATTPPPRRWWPFAVLVPIAAAALLFVLVPRGPSPDYIGLKGGNLGTLEVYLGDGRAGRRLMSGDVVHPQDGLRFFVIAPQHDAFVFTVDATGRVSALYPEQGGAPVRAEGLLPGGAVLDETTGPERVFAVFPTRPMTFDEVRAAAAQAFAHPSEQAVREVERLPLDAPQQSLLLEKVPR